MCYSDIMLILSLGAMVGISLTPAGKVVDRLFNLIASKSEGKSGSGDNSGDDHTDQDKGEASAQGEKETSEGVRRKNPHTSVPKVLESRSNRADQTASSNDQAKIAGDSESSRERKAEGVPGKSAETRPRPTEAGSQQTSGRDQQSHARTKETEESSHGNETAPPQESSAPALSSLASPPESDTAGEQNGGANYAPDEARVWSDCPIESVVEFSLQKVDDLPGTIRITAQSVREFVRRLSPSTRFRLFQVRYHGRAKPVEVYYELPDQWKMERELRLGAGPINIPNLPDPIPLELKVENRWGGSHPSYRYRANDRELIILTLEPKGGGTAVEVKKSEDAQGALPERVTAKLGFWVEIGPPLQKRIWVTVVRLTVLTGGNS
ncbi:MAG: hypothetical protein H5U08_04530 [Thermogutta sp.]|uniref:hypothetical protein n=1 Tax=Thermogutta sp. TaxID=1962930 RepID=UPI00198744AC|nr:hypothetical protein [Thermogutta sp.]MBC7351605.1 hypothetical protein [Thermogutta sp.]